MAVKISNKKPLSGNRRSHACNATKHSQKPNLQVVTINGIKVRISARELRTLKKDSKKVKISAQEVGDNTVEIAA